MRCQCPRQRDALLLAAGNLARLAFRELLHLHQLQHVGDTRIDLVTALAKHLQPKADVFGDRHMRKQRIALEDCVDRPLERRQQGDVLVIQEDLAVRGKLEPGDEAQQRCLAATRRPKQGEELVLADRHRHRVQGRDRAFSRTEDFSHFANVNGIPAR